MPTNQLYGFGNFEIQELKKQRHFDLHYNENASRKINDDVIKELESRYALEEQILDNISIGNLDRCIDSFCEKSVMWKEQRLGDTIRDDKNYLIIANTLFRKAAQRGKVHPVYLDELSRKMAAKIENINSTHTADELRKELIRKYCFLVNIYSTKGYSPIIQKVLNYISLHLSGDLSLTKIANIFSLNSSYLSTLFKKETGTTLTTFVNNKRIKHAIYLLNTHTESIQEIAVLCGIEDFTYFTKLFKKYAHMTPTAYRALTLC